MCCGWCAGKGETYKRLAKVVAVMAFAGFTAGLLGIGGALIFNPVLLQLGVQPQVSLYLMLLTTCLQVLSGCTICTRLKLVLMCKSLHEAHPGATLTVP